MNRNVLFFALMSIAFAMGSANTLGLMHTVLWAGTVANAFLARWSWTA